MYLAKYGRHEWRKQKRFWGLGAGGEGDDRGWDGWMAGSLTRWTWVWVNSRSWWWTGRPGVLRYMGSQRVGHDLATELNWTEVNWSNWAELKCYLFVLFLQVLSLWITKYTSIVKLKFSLSVVVKNQIMLLIVLKMKMTSYKCTF